MRSMVAQPTLNRPPFRPRLKLAVFVLLALVVASLVGNRGLIRLYRMHQAKAVLEREISQLTTSNAALAEEVRALRTDPGRVEAIAREELGLVKPGELVYEFRAAPGPSQSPGVR
jgi:cell division protein FtsB